MSSCEFCELILDNENSSRICELSVSVAIVNRDQTYHGRSLVILKKHLQDFLELSDIERNLFIADMTKIAQAIKRAYHPDMINYAIIGNHQNHLHWHIIPRYSSDPNWGQPPWPHDRKFLEPAQYNQIAAKIRKFIQ